MSLRASVLVGVLSGYAAGFVVLFVWTCRLYKRHGVCATLMAAVPTAMLGGALGGLLTLGVAFAPF